MIQDEAEHSRLDKIHSTGYWRVLIRPTVFEKTRIATLNECRKVVQSSVVELRGWDYPHWKDSEIHNGQDWIEGGSGFSSHIEYWRFHQSGQFVHHFAMSEDYEPNVFGSSKNDIDGPRLSILSTLFSVTEIYEFAARLCAKDVLRPAVDLEICLKGTQDRTLFFWQPGRYTNKAYTCALPEIRFEKQHSQEDLLGAARELAITATVSIFERFNWMDPPLPLLQNEQQKLIERRL